MIHHSVHQPILATARTSGEIAINGLDDVVAFNNERASFSVQDEEGAVRVPTQLFLALSILVVHPHVVYYSFRSVRTRKPPVEVSFLSDLGFLSSALARGTVAANLRTITLILSMLS